ncbi:hypothetical protein O3P69_005889 [Scylla paramamosain]|uniref:Uncharacterized protein n=1 Tax=Scylla paramamosain TaxID=85552 RepID=A0AAW0U565_SCYPA
MVLERSCSNVEGSVVVRARHIVRKKKRRCVGVHEGLLGCSFGHGECVNPHAPTHANGHGAAHKHPHAHSNGFTHAPPSASPPLRHLHLRARSHGK